MWSAFSVFSILSEIFRIKFRFQSLKYLDNIESITKGRPHVGNAKTVDLLKLQIEHYMSSFQNLGVFRSQKRSYTQSV